jgi:hypothetical protein
MKVIARNVFERPVILLFLTLTCLIPFSPFIQACPDPHDCSSEYAARATAELAYADARSEADRAYYDLGRAEDAVSGLDTLAHGKLAAMDAAKTSLKHYGTALDIAKGALSIALLGVIAASKTKNPWTMAAAAAAFASAGISLKIASSYLDEAKRAYTVAMLDYRKAVDDAIDAKSRRDTAKSIYDAKKALLDAARAALDSAEAALSSCGS